MLQSFVSDYKKISIFSLKEFCNHSFLDKFQVFFLRLYWLLRVVLWAPYFQRIDCFFFLQYSYESVCWWCSQQLHLDWNMHQYDQYSLQSAKIKARRTQCRGKYFSEECCWANNWWLLVQFLNSLSHLSTSYCSRAFWSSWTNLIILWSKPP